MSGVVRLKRTCGGGALGGACSSGRGLTQASGLPGSVVKEIQGPVAKARLAAVSSPSAFDKHEAGAGVLVSPYLSDLSGPG